MIFTRSPIYIDIDVPHIPDAVSYELRLFVWRGNFTPIPNVPNYVFKNHLNNSSAKVNISNYINDFFINEYPITSEIDNEVLEYNEVVHVYIEVDVITTTTTIVNTITYTENAIKGYRTYTGNRTIGNIISDGNNIKVYDKIVLPITTYGGTDMSVIATSYPSETILIEEYFTPPTVSSELIREVYISNFIPNDKYVTIKVRNDDTITYLMQNECKYTPINVQFKNKYGAIELITFFKKSAQTIDVKRSDFERKDYNRPIYNYNINARGSISCFSGYQNETFNELIKQLLLSEAVWLEINGEWLPHNVDTKSVTYKTKVNDKLVSYEISFLESFNTIYDV